MKKKIIIIGSNNSLLDKKRGKEIDSYDIVIRVNSHYYEYKDYIGTKTDYWAIWMMPCYDIKFIRHQKLKDNNIHMQLYTKYRKNLFKNLKEFWITINLCSWQNKILSKLSKNTKIQKMVLPEKYCKDFKKNEQSTGFITLCYTLNRFPNYDISLTGFGYLTEKNNYNYFYDIHKNSDSEGDHNFALEDRIIKKLHNEKKIKVLELS